MSLASSNVFYHNQPNCIILYHGSDHVVYKPTYGKGKSYNDYGRGFYCTEDEHQSDLWASAYPSGVTNKYELDLSNLKVLRLDKNDIFTWVAILVSNRSLKDLPFRAQMNCEEFVKKYNKVDLKDYDVVIGYRADDSYFSFMKSFLDGRLTLEYLRKALDLGNLGYQVALISPKAFDNLKFISSKEVNDHNITEEYFNRDRIARNTYKDYERKSYYSKSGFIDEFL